MALASHLPFTHTQVEASSACIAMFGLHLQSLHQRLMTIVVGSRDAARSATIT